MQITKTEKTIIWATAGFATACSLIILILWLRIKTIGKATTDNSRNMNLPRGYRNNNPLNMRISNSNWIGKISPNTDGAFEQFENMGYGFRAALKLLRNYIGQGNNTIQKMISKWAPANENNTTGYINTVSSRTGIAPTQIISRDDKRSLTAIAKAMAFVENGCFYNNIDTDIEAGWRML